MWYIHTREYYSAIENDVLIYAATWMDLENVMLSDRSQIHMATYYMIPFLGNVQKRQIHRDRKHMSSYQGLEAQENEE